MIRSTGELMFGEFFLTMDGSDLYTSNKFTSVTKIVQNCGYFMLCDGHIYYNDVITNDNYVKLCDNGITFIDIVPLLTEKCIAGLSIDNKLYAINSRGVFGLFPDYTDGVSVYCPYTSVIVIKKSDNTYHENIASVYTIHVNKYIGQFDLLYFCKQGFVVIIGDKVMLWSGTGLLEEIKIDIDMLCMIPEGSYLKFFDHNKIITDIAMTYSSNTILYCNQMCNTNVSICCVTGNVYNTDNNLVIPELKDCTFSRQIKKYSRTKNANF